MIFVPNTKIHARPGLPATFRGTEGSVVASEFHSAQNIFCKPGSLELPETLCLQSSVGLWQHIPLGGKRKFVPKIVVRLSPRGICSGTPSRCRQESTQGVELIQTILSYTHTYSKFNLQARHRTS